MRFSTFSQLVEEVRLESKISTNSSRGLDNRDNLEQIVKRNYEILWDDYEWEHLNVKHTDAFVQLYAGQNIYQFPDTIDLSTVAKVFASNGNSWVPVEYGITLQNYAQIDPTRNNRSDPVQNWEARSMTEFEVFPLPASNVERIGFEAKKKFVQLVDQTDVAQIDSLCIVLISAAELLASNNAKESQLKLKMAEQRIDKFKARMASKTRFRIGMGSGTPANKPRQLRVAYVRN